MDEQQQPNTLIQFQAHVVNGQTNEIHAFIEALAQEASNNYLQALATEYKFTTFWEPDAYHGKRIMLARDLARLCYGTEDLSSLRRLCERHGFPYLSLPEASGYHNQKLTLLHHFNLSKFASHSRFATWDHVLIATANGETEFARKVWSHIQTHIMYAFADLESRRQTGQGVQENVTEQLEKARLERMAAEQKALALQQARYALYETHKTFMSGLGMLDDRDKQMLADLARQNISGPSLMPSSIEASSAEATPLSTPQPMFFVADRVRELKYHLTRKEEASVMSPLARKVAQEFRRRYKREPSQGQRYVDGALRPVFCYLASDQEWMDSIIQAYMAESGYARNLGPGREH